MESRIVPVLVAAALAVFTIWLWHSMQDEERRWAEFVITHECKVIGRVDSSTGLGVGVMSNGQVGTVVTTTPAKTGYACNDGITYWR